MGIGARKSTNIPGLFYRDGKRGRSYFISKSICGETLNCNIGVVSLAEARKVYNQKVADFQNGDRASEKAPVRSLKVIDMLNIYWRDHLTFLPSGPKNKCHLNALVRLIGNKKYSQLNKVLVDSYLRARGAEFNQNTGHRVGPRSLQAEIKLLKAAINHCVDMEMVPSNPIVRFGKVKLPPPKKVILDDGINWGPEWRALYDAMGAGIKESLPLEYRRSRALLLTLYETGMRPKEAFNMAHSWLHEVQDGYWVISVPAISEKTSRGRDIPVSDVLYDSLSVIHRPGSDELFFPSPRTGRVRTESGIKKAFRNAVKAAGLSGKEFTPYALRRTRTTIWDAIDEGACRAAIGHSPSDSHAKHYVRITRKRLFRLVGKEVDIQSEFRLVKAG